MPADPARTPRTRLAPSPTGALHLGNARTFLVNWALARRRGWRIVLRLEDLDGPRVKPGVAEQTIRTLEWLGMDWDEGPFVQSEDTEPYESAMSRLAGAGLAYPSALSRAQADEAAEALSAPQEGVHESAFPASLRPPLGPRTFDDRTTNWRFATPAGPVPFEDEFVGASAPDPSRTVGDFIIWTKRGQPAYQLAVVVDDARQGVTHVVRGDDLLDSAGRQLRLYRALGLSPEPTYTHLPLVLGPDGRRLAKRHGDTRVEHYRARGVEPERVVALVAGWCGVSRPERMSAAEFRDALDLRMIPRTTIMFTPEDDAWLLAGG